MSIRSNIEKIIKQVQDATPDTAQGDEIRRKAVDAIMKGEGSKEWRSYMEMFAENEEQLARLIPTDDTKGVYEMDVARTYLLGNGPCGAQTVDRLIYGVDDKLDEGLNGNSPDDGNSW
ncbi:MAG: hypothetical protein M3367_12915 [Acidobacteriota bacterium]|nr:hypothetical protein [Acidobacteriota bacterium]